MKKGDKVYVDWPTGKGGPYEVIKIDKITGTDITIKIPVNDDCWSQPTVPIGWCETADTEIEEGRLVYINQIYKSELGTAEISAARLYRDGLEETYDVRPVHRRWDELSEDEKISWANHLYEDSRRLFKRVYKLITGEEHP